MSQVFYDAVRENTGAHFLDSGGAYGRHHEKAPVTPEDPAVTLDIWGSELSATLETAHFLSDALDPDTELQAAWEDFDAEREESYMETAEDFMESLGYVQRARDNVYNGENDLSQVYVWEVYTRDPDSDWVWDEDAVAVVYVHTGCDVRGGYTRPIFCRSRGDYSIPVDLCAEYYAFDRDGPRWDLCERWASGYSSWPTGEVNGDVERVFGWTRSTDSVVALLKTGEVVRITASAPVTS